MTFAKFDQIQWIVTKHKIGMVSRNNQHLIIIILSEEEVKIKFLLLCLEKYLFSVVSKENVLFSTITRNVTLSRKVALVVNILFLDFVMIHWIQRHSFWKNSIIPPLKAPGSCSPAVPLILRADIRFTTTSLITVDTLVYLLRRLLYNLLILNYCYGLRRSALPLSGI